MKLMEDYDCKSILEVGCGKAKIRNLPGYCGLDFSIKALQRSGLKEFILADITKRIPLPDKTFDVVSCGYVLLHIHPDKIEKAIIEMCRVAKKMVLICEPPYGTFANQKFSFSHDLKTLFTKHFSGNIIFVNDNKVTEVI